MSSVTFEGGPELAAGLAALTDVRELVTANGVAARALQASARDLAPSRTGSLAGSVVFTEADDGFDVGTNSPYGRWFHVPYLSDGGVTYASKVSRTGHTYGQAIPNNPFLITAVIELDQTLFGDYVTATGDLIDRALASVPRG
jgi:hypothetical protein